MKLVSQRLKIRCKHLIDVSQMNLGRSAMHQAINISGKRIVMMRKVNDVKNRIYHEALYNETE